ncbi:hypothetical protein B5S31_g3014 [[Candida] boidinii]|nr:hypothetical protein B5S31_g3014 [[Candida] boidinii]
MSTPFTFSTTRLKNGSSSKDEGLVGSQPPSSSESIFNVSQSDFTGTSKNSLLNSSDLLPASADYQVQLNELTRSDYYRVCELPSLPRILKDSTETIISGYSDPISEHSLVITNNSVHVWRYTSSESVPITVAFPYTPNNKNIPPQAIIIPNSSLDSNLIEPGLLIIDSLTGSIKYYPSIQIASSSIGFLNSSSHSSFTNNKSYSLNLNLKNEFIHLAKYIQDVGVVIATSTKKVSIILLTDNTGKPSLSKLDLLNNSKSSIFNIFNSINAYNLEHFQSNDKIISINQGKLFTHGSREIIIQDSNGTIDVFEYSRNNGLNHLISQSLKSRFVDSVSGMFPNCDNSFKFEETVSLNHLKNHTYLILCSIIENDTKIFFLFTVIVDEHDCMVYSTYRINNFNNNNYVVNNNNNNTEFNNARLLVPEPYTTAYIVYNNTIILTDVLQDLNDAHSLTHKWEDFISFKDDIHLLGVGLDSNSIITISQNSGILKVERTSNLFSNNDNSIDSNKNQDPAFINSKEFIKSHILQAIIYNINDKNPLYFDLNFELSNYDIESATTEITNEIINNDLKNLSKRFPNLIDHLYKRYSISNYLCSYISRNFAGGNTISKDLKFKILSNTLKLNLAISFYLSIKDDEKILNILNKLVKDHFNLTGIDEFFYDKVDKIIELLSILLNHLKEENHLNTNLEKYLTIVFETIKDYLNQEDILLHELDLSFDTPLKFSPNFVHTDLLFQINNLLIQISEKYAENYNEDLSVIIYELTKFLYYSTNNLLIWFPKQELNDYSKLINNKFIEFFENNRKSWIQLFILLGQQLKSLEFAEYFEDLISISEILENERETVVDELELTSGDIISKEGLSVKLSKISLIFDTYFSKFGYVFANTLFRYYIDNDKYKMVLIGFPSYHEYVIKFLNDDPVYGNILWIRLILDGEYEKAGESLIKYFNYNENDTIERKKLQLSIAKLSLIANDEGDDSLSSTFDSSDLLEEISLKNNLIDLQILIKQNFSSELENLNKTDDKLNVIKSNLNPIYTKDESIINFKHEMFIKFLNDKLLNVADIVDILTIITIDSNDLNNFYQAFKLIALIKQSQNSHYSPRFIKLLEILIWKRLVLTKDDKIILNTLEKLINSGLLNLPNNEDGLILTYSTDDLIIEFSNDDIKTLNYSDKIDSFKLLKFENNELVTLSKQENISSKLKSFIESLVG